MDLFGELQDDNTVLLDTRFSLLSASAGRDAYHEGHIPGAAYLDLDNDLAAPVTATSGRHPLPDAETAARAFRRAGVNRDSRVVVYDDSAGSMAARAWWMLRWLGHEQVRLLDGGINAWQEEAFQLECGQPVIHAGDFRADPRPGLVVGTSALQEIDLSETALLDARDAERFSGLVEPIDAVAGHIPGAENFPYLSTIDEVGRFLATERLRKLWVKALRRRMDRESIVMCGSGVTACHLIVSALLAGAREPRLYVGSWSEWIRDPLRPIASDVGTA
jgi:thiosulfate/3-mercaptopyruvate sulfurtransferase